MNKSYPKWDTIPKDKQDELTAKFDALEKLAEMVKKPRREIVPDGYISTRTD